MRLTWQKSPFPLWFCAGKGASVKYLLKSCLLVVLLLGCAAALPAQRFISGPGVSSYGGYGGGGYGYSGYGWSDYGWGYNFGGWGFSDCCLHHPEEHPPFSVGFAHGDPDYVQSTFMDYNQALALGKRILEEQAKPQPSLGEIARRLRQHKRNYVPPPAPELSPTPNPEPSSRGGALFYHESYTVVQDSDGRPILCRHSDTVCRNSA